MAINLLPADFQKEIMAERASRLIQVAGIFIFIIIVINITPLFPFWLGAILQEKELQRELAAIQQSSLFVRVADIEAAIAELNHEIGLFKAKDERFELGPVIKQIIALKPRRVQVKSFHFEQGDKSKNQPSRLTLLGNAQNRASLLDFVKANESSGLFSSVRSPISNLLREADIDYSLILELNDER